MYGDKCYYNFCGLNVSKDGVEYKSFTIISSDSLIFYEKKYYLEVYLDNFADKNANTEMTDYLDV